MDVVTKIIYAENAENQKNDKLQHFAGKVYRLNKDGELEEVKEDRQQQKKLIENATKIENKTEILNIQSQNIDRKGSDPYMNIRDHEEEYRYLLLERFDNLRSLLSLMQNKHRNVSAIWKSRIDWKKFSKISNMEQQFTQNRKDGFINKQAFVNKVNLKDKKRKP